MTVYTSSVTCPWDSQSGKCILKRKSPIAIKLFQQQHCCTLDATALTTVAGTSKQSTLLPVPTLHAMCLCGLHVNANNNLFLMTDILVKAAAVKPWCDLQNNVLIPAVLYVTRT